MKRGLIKSIIIIVLVPLLLVNFGLANEITDDYFDIAMNYYNSNNLSKAIEYVEYILKIEPDNVQALELKNKINPKAPDRTQAEVLQTAEALNQVKSAESFVILNIPQADVAKMDYNSDYYNTKGQEFYKKKDYNSAIEYFFKAISLDKRNQQAYNNLAMAYWMKNNPKLAIKYLKRANFINRKYTQPLVNLSLIYKQLGDEKKQIYYLKKAIRQNPNDYWAYYLLGEYYKDKACYAAAIENYKESIKIDKKFSQAYLGLAMSFFEIEEFNYSILTMEQYLELVPESDFAMFMLARANLVLGQYETAKKYVQKAILISDKPEYEYELGKIEYYMENYQDAMEIFQQFLLKNTLAEAFNYIGLCNYKLKQMDAAILHFNRAIELDGLRPIYYYNLAQCYKSLGDKKNYAKNMNSATRITPINYQDFIDLSYIYFDNSNSSYAINTLNDAIRRYPDIKALYLSKLKIYEAIGDNLHYNEVKDLINERFNAK